MTGRLAGKVALITGIGGGIGATAARMFAAEGAKVVGCDLDEAGAAQTAASVRAAGGEITAAGGVDLGDPAQAKEWVDEAVQVYDGLDVLYNNASAQRFGALDELSVEDWDFTMRNELNLVYYTVRAAWPHLKRHGGGSIINVGSIAAMRGVEFMPQNAHSAAKGAVIALTLQLVVEGGPFGIRANVISPGMTETRTLRRCSPIRRTECAGSSWTGSRWAGTGSPRTWSMPRYSWLRMSHPGSAAPTLS